MDLLSAPLHSFLKLAELGSVSGAARVLGLSQPAVTKQIRALEAQIGGTLIERAGRGIRLTAGGELLQSFGQRAARALAEYAAALADLQQGNSGRLRLGAGVTTSVLQLPPWLSELRRRHPGIDVSVRTGTSADVERWVLQGDVDLGFVTSEPRRPELVVRKLFEEKIVLVVGDGARAKRALELESLSLILFPKHTGFRRYLEQRFAARGLAVNVKMETDSVEAIKSFVAVGLGASFLPITAVKHELVRGSLMQARARGLGALRRRTALVRRVDHLPTFAMARFLEIVGNGPAGVDKRPRTP